MNSVKTVTLSPGILCLSRITLSSKTITAINLHTSSECNSRKNHYETLNLSSTATHNEIKSAYYNLTMQYHPDKNASEDAKIKFQEISEAYEVLCNFASRSQYDRMLLARSKPQRPSVRMGGYNHRVRRTESHAPPKYPKDMKVFDFDEWTKQHYGTVFRDSQRIKKYKQTKADTYEHIKYSEFDHLQGIKMFVLMCFVSILSATIILGVMNRNVVNTKSINDVKKQQPPE